MIPKFNGTNGPVAFFAGSFNPFTTGHASLVERGLGLFGRIIIGVGINEQKASSSDTDSRVADIAALYSDEPRVSVTGFSCLTTEAAIKHGATHLLRGVRSTVDFEYERNMADINRRISGLETVLLYALPELACVSSSAVRELRHFGADITEFLPGKHT